MDSEGEAPRSGNRQMKWINQAKLRAAFRSPVMIFALVNLPFLFVFYDQFNFNAAIYASSYLVTGLNPFHFNSSIVAGYTILPYSLITYYLYELLGFQTLAVAAVLKVIALAFTYMAGYLLWRIAKAEGCRRPEVILYSFVLNPFITMVNVVWVQTDALVTCLLLFGYALLYYGWHRNSSLPALALGSACLLWTVFSYYSLVVLLPTLIIYRDGVRAKLVTLGMFALIAEVLAVPILRFDLVTTFFSVVRSGSPSATVYSVFNLLAPESGGFVASASIASLILIAIAAVFIPAFLKQSGFVEPLSLFAALSFAFLFVVSPFQGDNFALLVGPLLLALIFVRATTVTYGRVFLLQAFLLPQMLIVQLFNGPGTATGIFYWTYYVFHYNVVISNALGSWGTFLWKLSLLIYLAALCCTVAYLVHANMRPTRPPEVTPHPSEIETLSGLPHIGGRALTVASILTTGVAILLIVPSFITPHGGIGSPQISNDGLVPDYFMTYDYTRSPPSAYVLASPSTFTVETANSSIYFSPASPPIGFFRNLSNQVFTLHITPTVLFPQTHTLSNSVVILDGETFAVGLATTVVVNNSMSLTPSNDSAYSSVRNGSTPALYGETKIYSLNGTGVLDYTVSPSNLSNVTVAFGLELSSYGQGQNILWAMNVQGVGYEAFLSDGSLYLGYTENGSWVFEVAPFNTPSGQWYTSGFDVNPQGTMLSSFVNDVTLSVPFSVGSGGTTTLYVGKYDNSDQSNYQFATDGNFTTAYLVPEGYNIRQQFAYYYTPSGGFMATAYNHQLTLDLFRNGTASTVSIGPSAESFPAASQIWIGKLSPGPTPLYIMLSQISISTDIKGIDLQVVVIGFSILIPCSTLWWYNLAQVRPFRRRTPR